jgi:hypothetical protein
MIMIKTFDFEKGPHPTWQANRGYLAAEVSIMNWLEDQAYEGFIRPFPGRHFYKIRYSQYLYEVLSPNDDIYAPDWVRTWPMDDMTPHLFEFLVGEIRFEDWLAEEDRLVNGDEGLDFDESEHEAEEEAEQDFVDEVEEVPEEPGF